MGIVWFLLGVISGIILTLCLCLFGGIIDKHIGPIMKKKMKEENNIEEMYTRKAYKRSTIGFVYNKRD